MNRQKFAEVAGQQKAAARDLAEKVRNGESLTPLDRRFAAALILRGADSIPDEKPVKRGLPGRIPAEIYIEFAMLRVHSAESQTSAINELAARYCVGTDSVREMLGFKGKKADPESQHERREKTEAAMRFLNFM